jgi:hypothetical protein
MGGVGNFMDDSRTLYIGGLKSTSYESPQVRGRVLASSYLQFLPDV